MDYMALSKKSLQRAWSMRYVANIEARIQLEQAVEESLGDKDAGRCSNVVLNQPYARWRSALPHNLGLTGKDLKFII